jgi:hypothetical protein
MHDTCSNLRCIPPDFTKFKVHVWSVSPSNMYFSTYLA